ncbi:MAG: DUF6290 family protein, partial [Spirochaetales bacterium]
KAMSTLSVRLPDSLHEMIKRFSRNDNISINQFIASAVTEKITALETEEYLQERAKLGNREAAKRVMAKVPDVPPDLIDR